MVLVYMETPLKDECIGKLVKDYIFSYASCHTAQKYTYFDLINSLGFLTNTYFEV